MSKYREVLEERSVELGEVPHQDQVKAQQGAEQETVRVQDFGREWMQQVDAAGDSK
ncbi:hypothetical protein [Deinococcus psychrotolerans]|uniref:hypothetical protein n=1 Tax=Deinococcus psychrotolerans TaxID=2489213 RepID=UPI0013DDE8DD|nr:hypothetical protein [Deinococcus psychrotolerans]